MLTPDDLRRNANGSVQPEHDLLLWAADEIEQLRAALEDIGAAQWGMDVSTLRRLARRALREE